MHKVLKQQADTEDKVSRRHTFFSTPDDSANASPSNASETIRWQAEKIRSLLHDNEALGATNAQLVSILRRLNISLENNPDESIRELLDWKDLGQRELGPTIGQAQAQAKVLWYHTRNMAAPGHRLVNFLDYKFGSSRFGLAAKRFFAFLYAIYKA